MLTNLACKRAQHKNKPYKLYDTEGLFLYVSPTSKLWRMCYKFNKKSNTLSFGKYPYVSLVTARRLRDEAREELDQGINPALKRKQKKAMAKMEDDLFANAFKGWLEVMRPRWTRHHAQHIQSAMTKNVLPSLGSISLSMITPPMILTVLRRIEKQSIDKARRIRASISAVFRYGIAMGLCETDPALHLGNILKPLVKGHQPAITNLKELQDMMVCVDNAHCHPLTKLAMRFQALTALRTGELMRITWDDLRENDILTVPAGKMKMKRDHIVPLARQSVEVLKAAKEIGGDKFIFPSARRRHHMMSNMTLGKLLKSVGYKGIHVPHGFRSSFSSIMNEKRPADRYIIDLMLAHINRNNVEAAYNRAEHVELRRQIAQDWADLLCERLVPAAELIK